MDSQSPALQKIYVAGQTQSKQIKKDDDFSIEGTIEPMIQRSPLLKAIEDSFVLAGIVERVGSGANSGFRETPEELTDKTGYDVLWRFLESLDLQTMFVELFTTGNSFFEVMTSKDKKYIESDHILLETIRVKKDTEKGGFKQKSGTETESFENNEVLHIKTTSLRDKNYGVSKFYSTISQVVLLATIDRFYTNLLDKGNIKTKILQDVSGKLSDDQMEALNAILDDATKGIENSFKTMLISADIKTTDLQDDVETTAFLEYRKELIKSICVGCAFPYDLLVADNSNRSTSEVAQEQLNKYVIKPLQEVALRQIKQFLATYYSELIDAELIDAIEFTTVDTSNEKEVMEILTGYRKADIIDANEARRLSPYSLPDREDGNTLGVSGKFYEDQKIEKIKKTIGGWYSEKVLAHKQSHV